MHPSNEDIAILLSPYAYEAPNSIESLQPENW